MDLAQYFSIIQQNKYAYSLAILAAFYILSRLVILASRHMFLRLAGKTRTDVDDLIAKKISKPVSMILLLIGIRLAIIPLGIPQKALEVIEHGISSLIIAVITYTAIVVIDIFVDAWGRRVAEKTKSPVDGRLIPLFHKFSRIFISVVGLLFILPVWGVQVGPLLTSLGIAGIAIAFALQSTLGNIFGGMSLILDKSIKVGDKIKLDNDAMGTVIDVGLRSTKIKTWDNELITVPNGKLADARILNFMRPGSDVRVVLPFGAEYGSDVSKVRKVVLDTLSAIPQVLKEPAPRVLLADLGDFALKFNALFYVRNFDVKQDVKALAAEEIYNALKKANAGMQSPLKKAYFGEERQSLP